MSEAALAVVEQDDSLESPTALMRRATDVAGVCREIVLRTAMELGGKRYVRVEGWEAIAVVYGCIPSIREVVEEERGVKAVAELKTRTGQVIASAEGFVGLDEPTWSNRAMYARRGMAQSRAISRVCRSVFAFVVVLIDGNLQTTPAEEIPVGGEVVVMPVVQQPQSSASVKAPPERTKATTVRYGRSKNKFLCDIEPEDLKWQLAAARRSVEANDPTWGASNKEWLATVEAEVTRRG